MGLLLGVFGGAVVGWVLAMAVYFLFFSVPDPGGEKGMLFALAIGPVAGMVCASIFILLGRGGR